MTIKGTNTQLQIIGANPMTILAGSEGSAVLAALRENAGAIELGTVTESSGVYTWDKLYTDLRIKRILIPIQMVDDAASDTWSLVIFYDPVDRYTITRADLITPTAFGQDTNYASLSIENKTQATQIVDLDFTAANATTEHTPKNWGSLSNTTITEGDVLAIDKAITSSGQALPNGSALYLELQRVAI